jgi:hypothetical protein
LGGFLRGFGGLFARFLDRLAGRFRSLLCLLRRLLRALLRLLGDFHAAAAAEVLVTEDHQDHGHQDSYDPTHGLPPVCTHA